MGAAFRQSPETNEVLRWFLPFYVDLIYRITKYCSLVVKCIRKTTESSSALIGCGRDGERQHPGWTSGPSSFTHLCRRSVAAAFLVFAAFTVSLFIYFVFQTPPPVRVCWEAWLPFPFILNLFHLRSSTSGRRSWSYFSVSVFVGADLLISAEGPGSARSCQPEDEPQVSSLARLWN